MNAIAPQSALGYSGQKSAPGGALAVSSDQRSQASQN